MCINRGGCNVRSGDEYRLAPTHVTLDIPFKLVLFVSRLLEASGLGVGLVGKSRRGAWMDALDTAQRSTAPHATRLHVIDVTQMP